MAEVIWTSEANQMRKDILEYGYEHFGELAANKLNKELEEAAHMLASFPDIGPRLDLPQTYRRVIQRLVVNKLFSLIYFADKPAERVYIIAIYDCRRDPAFLSHL